MIFVIDDERTFACTPYEGDFKYARTSKEGLVILCNHWSDYVLHYAPPIFELWLDHDLGENDTIRPVVDFLYIAGRMDGGLTPSLKDIIHNIYVHSQNPTTDWIVDFLSPLYSNVKRVPLPRLK